MDAVVKIERMAYSPDAVGHLPNGKTVFVEGAAPGDTVDIKVTEDKSTYARARVERILEASPVRTAPTSQVDLLCGTAPWQHLQYDALLEYKRANFVDAIILMYYLIRSVTSLGVANWHSPELMIWWLFLFTIREDQGIHRLYRNENIRLMEERSNWKRRDMGLTTGLRGGVEENG